MAVAVVVQPIQLLVVLVALAVVVLVETMLQLSNRQAARQIVVLVVVAVDQVWTQVQAVAE
jgi:hypothetical protein